MRAPSSCVQDVAQGLSRLLCPRPMPSISRTQFAEVLVVGALDIWIRRSTSVLGGNVSQEYIWQLSIQISSVYRLQYRLYGILEMRNEVMNRTDR
jgi:hypothetical protein